MIRGLDNAFLMTDLDFDGYGLRNCKTFDAVNLLHRTDPSLSDPRTMLPGSVTNASVKEFLPPQSPDPDDIPPPIPPEDVRIVQSKLNLNGNLPLSFVTPPSDVPDSDHGVRGDLYQPKAEKAVNNGYASLDANKRIPSTQIPLAGTGTLKELFVTTPVEFALVPPVSPIAGQITLAGSWNAAPKVSWLGNPTVADDGRPRFYLGKIPATLVPSLGAAIITTGVLSPDVLPVAVGVGSGHASGAMPDPGKTGDPTDYLGRDMQWRSMTRSLAYQPTLQSPAISVISTKKDVATVAISQTNDAAAIFYRVSPMTGFAEYTGPVELPLWESIEAYAVLTGYNPSPISYFTNTFDVELTAPPPI
jgi:hypothetical protein